MPRSKLSRNDVKKKKIKVKEMPNRIEDLSPIPHSPLRMKKRFKTSRNVSPKYFSNKQ